MADKFEDVLGLPEDAERAEREFVIVRFTELARELLFAAARDVDGEAVLEVARFDDPASCVFGMAVPAEPAPPEMPLPSMGLSIFLNEIDSVFEVERPDELDEPLADVEMRRLLNCCADDPLLCAIAAPRRRSYVKAFTSFWGDCSPRCLPSTHRLGRGRIRLITSVRGRLLPTNGGLNDSLGEAVLA